jgi:diguanylate cyclase (GGDEF)-like protein
VFALFLSKRFWLGFIGFIVAAGGVFLGAQAAFSKDYVIEPFVLFLGPLAALVFGVIAVSLKLFLENRGLETKVIHDKMTGLYTYEYLRVRLDDEWQRSRKLKTSVSVVMTDLDRFKKINDTLGHEVGNEMIKRTAAVIKESVRGYDVVSRYGGDEFMVLLWHASQKDAKEYRLRLRDQYHAMAKKLQPELQDSSISIGVATFDPQVDPKFPPNAQTLVEIADKDLFEDKESRRPRSSDRGTPLRP